jgi:hypothetical protein
VYFLRKKSEVFEHLKDFKAHVETQSKEEDQNPPHRQWGGICELICPTYFSEAGIQLQHTIPYTLQQNGVAERKNRSLKEMATCMLHARYLPSNIWDEALNYDNYIQNISPHIYVKDMTPFEAWSGNKTIIHPLLNIWITHMGPHTL